ncbi:MAG: GlsB/YeaQ/YmgE family stress response membrane protein, partial [Bacteroidales bacterium]|nr:GlsB/YeaQ/YmgE family stress response membrane protein [Bacteroidales bacterium]
MNWIYVIVLGIVAGYIASRIKGSGGNGCIIDLILGVVGSAVGGWIVHLLGISTSGYGCLGQLLVAVIGAIVVL